jgi:hypothetical protein
MVNVPGWMGTSFIPMEFVTGSAAGNTASDGKSRAARK